MSNPEHPTIPDGYHIPDGYVLVRNEDVGKPVSYPSASSVSMPIPEPASRMYYPKTESAPVVSPTPAPFNTTIILGAVLSLLHSRKFLVFALATAQTLVFMLNPQFNQDVWKAIDGLAVVLIGSIAHEDAAALSAGVGTPKT